MLSRDKDVNKHTQLEQLRASTAAKRMAQANQSKPSTSSSAIPSSSSTQSPYSAPPSQHRDATISSRFFPPTQAPTGNILVPNSSPIPLEDPSSKPYQPYGHSQRRDASSSSGFSSSTRPLGRPAFTSDPLSSSSGFVSHSKPTHATARRQWQASETTNHDEGPPRKKINRGPSSDILSISGSPPSPDIHRVGQRRNGVAIAGDAMSISSDESLADTLPSLAGPSRPRPATTQPSSKAPSQALVEPTGDLGYNMFKITRAGDPPARIVAAWMQSGGDEQKANMLMSNSNWSPTKSQPPTPAQNNRTRELDLPKVAQRLSEKEKGKRSSIYATRNMLDTKATAPMTPPPVMKASTSMSVLSPTVVASPISPVLRVPQRKKARKMVIDSESEDAESDGDSDANEAAAVSVHEIRALEYLNTSGAEALQELTGCSPEQASAIIDLRPFDSPEAARSKLAQGKKKSNGLTARMFEDCVRMLQGYGSVDSVLEECERIGSKLRKAISAWSPEDKVVDNNSDDGGLSLVTLNPKNQSPQNYLTTQPSLLAPGVTLKDYQLLGVNWLNLLYSSNYSCILADEMGLGKTIQVISFLAYLKQQGKMGPHLIVVPSSTLENWCREFGKFAPTLNIQTYYADKADRPALRQTLIDSQKCNTGVADHWEVLITTYNLAQGDERDRKFFKKIEWDCCVYDEGHVLKNFQSQRYQTLLKVKADWKLLLTGTPLQNNLQELVSLLNFILPRQFADSIESLRAIFKVKGDTKVTLLSQERISRAKKIMTPFVLRRRKDQVLKDLPKKTERIEWCDMTDLQRSIYRKALQRSRKTIVEAVKEADDDLPAKPAKKTKAATKAKVTSYSENSSNVLMELRKAASHPMLFRTLFTDDTLTGITKQLLKEPDFKKRGALFDLVKEDMSVMTDSELQFFCATYKSTKKYLQDEACYIDAGKVQVLLKLLSDYEEQGRKVLIFSQFTQILDILQAVLKHRDTKYLLLTGSTPVDVRQTLVDEFTEDSSIPVFLLSTKAGGMGINLTAASVVIMFDQDFNPHNDRQAQDRAYRIGQKRDVDVVKLISKGTIEEDMLRLGETKLALDSAVAGDDEKEGEGAPEREMKTSLMKVLRQQFEEEEGGGSAAPEAVKT